MKTLYAILRWPWTPWRDVATFVYEHNSYLVQGRTSVVTNRRQFRCTRCDGGRPWKAAHTHTVTAEVLERAGMFDCTPDRVVGHVDINFIRS